MNRKHIIFLLFIIFMGKYSNAQNDTKKGGNQKNQIKPFYKHYNLKGNVKSIEEKYLHDSEIDRLHTIEFDKKGNILKDVITDIQMGQIEETKYKLNEKNQIDTVIRIIQSKGNESTFMDKNQYDSFGNNISSIIIGDSYLETNGFDSNGYLTSRNCKENGKILDIAIYINNKNGDCIYYTAKGDAGILKILTTYKYDVHLNWVEKTEKQKMGAGAENTFISYRTISYY